MRDAKIRAVRAALGTLSESDRQIIYLAHQQDFNSAQIAEILEKPSISAVTSHLHRAMKHLKTALEKSGWFDELRPSLAEENLSEEAARKRA
jgi:DNA-directed RNA polymerase specialized sigma24 family protein